MAREEEIISAGVEYTESKSPRCIGGQSYSYEIFQMNRNRAFEEGAKWADHTMLERAICFIEDAVCEGAIETGNMARLIENFKEAMGYDE